MTVLAPRTPTTSATEPQAGTRALLGCAAVSAPLWTVVSLTQAATRRGFDLTRHPLSALSTGDLGGLQISNFVLAGVLTVAGALGLGRVLHHGIGGTWVRRLMTVSGLGQVAAGVLVMDPGGGFPLGAPEGMPTAMSWHSVGHMAADSVSFLAFGITCFVLGRRFARTGRRGFAVASRVAGTALALGDGWAMTGGAYASLTMAAGVITAMLWVALVAADQLRRP